MNKLVEFEGVWMRADKVLWVGPIHGDPSRRRFNYTVAGTQFTIYGRDDVEVQTKREKLIKLLNGELP